MPNSPQHQRPGGQSASKLAGTMQLEGALSVGPLPEDSGHKRSLGAKQNEDREDEGAPAAEPDASPMAGRGLAHPCRVSTSGEAAPACPTGEASREDPGVQ